MSSGPGQTFATVEVGATKTKFVVHESLLVYHSEFFRAALKGRFAEAETKTVTLEDEDEAVFELFVFWLYHKRYAIPSYIRPSRGPR